MQYAVGMQCPVGVGTKRSTGTVDLANMGGGDCYLSAKRSLYPQAVDAVGAQYTVGMQYAVCSRYAVHSRYAVRSRCECKKVNSHSGLSKYGWCGLLPLVQKGQTHAVGYAVCSMYAVGMQWVLVQKGQLT